MLWAQEHLSTPAPKAPRAGAKAETDLSPTCVLGSGAMLRLRWACVSSGASGGPSPLLLTRFVCVYVCVRACMHACMHACLDACACVCVAVCVCASVSVSVHTRASSGCNCQAYMHTHMDILYAGVHSVFRKGRQRIGDIHQRLGLSGIYNVEATRGISGLRSVGGRE